MDAYKLLVLQFIAHFLSDFLFQSQKCSDNKEKEGFKSKFLYKHIAVSFLLSAILSFQFSFIVFSLIISISHFLFDGIKNYSLNFKFLRKYLFFTDQILHISVIILVVFLYNKYFENNFIVEIPEIKYLLYIFAYILILKPTNILIREIFKFYEIKIDKSLQETDELPNAGKLIGITERVLTLTLIILGQYSAIGFIMAAKSILRFKEAETQKAEYVLIGTMLSFGIAIMLGVMLHIII